MGSILAIAVSEIIKFRKKASHEDVKNMAAKSREDMALPAGAFSLTSGSVMAQVGVARMQYVRGQ